MNTVFPYITFNENMIKYAPANKQIKGNERLCWEQYY